MGFEVPLDTSYVHQVLCRQKAYSEASMRATLAINEELLYEVKLLSGAKTVSVALRRGESILRERPEIKEEVLRKLVK